MSDGNETEMTGVSMVILGKLVLNWCDNCNVPVLESKRCWLCDGPTKKVKLTPPGDIRPAFNFDRDMIRAIVDTHFGSGFGEKLLPSDKIVLLNKAPDVDRMDEVILDGVVIGALRYDISRKKFVFLLRPRGAHRLMNVASSAPLNHTVIADEGAVEPILNGASMLAPGVIDADKKIECGDEVLLFDDKKAFVGVGTARMNGEEMLARGHGVAVKVRFAEEIKKESEEKSLSGGQTWETVLKANGPVMKRKIEEATKFIRDAVEKNKRPYAVSFSGGKDSLATLLLVLEAGYRPPVFFIDTGLEFEETKRHAEDTAARFGLPLIIEKARTSYFDNVNHFGPSGRDFRWCCKTCKLAPMAALIKRHTGSSQENKIISFIGQRRYESEQRASSGPVWNNPWVPNQIGASPIQNWTALHVWLYIFMKGVPYNPLYEHGMNRIGCWLCPASDLADFRIIRELPSCKEISERWSAFLRSYADEHRCRQSWLDYGLWRWRHPPKELLGIIERAGGDVSPEQTEKGKSNFLTFAISDEGPDEGQKAATEIRVNGTFNAALNIERVSNLLTVFGEVAVKEGRCTVACKDATITAAKDGAVAVSGRDERTVKKTLDLVCNVITRAHYCLGCGLCVSLCRNDALRIENGHAVVDGALCIHCRDCLGRCPVINFSPRA